MIKTRNKPAHSIAVMPDHKGDVHFASLFRMPFDDLSRPMGATKPHKLPSLCLFEEGLVNWFAQDLKELVAPERLDGDAVPSRVHRPWSPPTSDVSANTA
jgi:hypothetical protein